MKTERFFGRAAGALVVLTALLGSIARAQAPLADRVPGDSIAYIGWAGSDNVPGFAGSRFEALLNASNLPGAFQQVVPALIQRLAKEDAEAAKHADQIYKLLSLVSHHPTAVFFQGIGQGANGDPIPRMGLICRVGAERAAQLRDQIAPMVQDAPAEVMLRVGVSGDDLAVTVGYDDVNAALAKDASGSLAGAAAFTGAMKQVTGQTGSSFCGWLNIEQAFEVIDQIVHTEAPEEGRAMYDKIVEASGLRGLKHGIFASGFDGKDWMSNMFVAAPAPRKGLLSLADGPPVGDDLLKAIPVDAEVAMAGSLDFAQIVNTLREVAGQVDPQYKKMFDQGLGAAQMALGVNLQTNVLEPLGPHWALYSARSVAGGGLPGVVLLNKPDDAVKAKQGLNAITIFANNMSNTFLAQEDIFVQVKPLKVGDQDIQYVAVPFVAPSWSVVDGYAMFGLFPQTLVDARHSMKTGGKSILDNPQYQALRQRLGQKEVRSVFYADLPQTAADSYWLMLVISRLAGFGDMLAGVPTPPMIMPPYSVLKEHLTPAGGVSWVDDAGMHGRSVGPFPGAEMFQGTLGGSMLTSSAPMMVSILLPSLNRARETANRVKCANNLRQLGLASKLYSNENNGKVADDFATLLNTQDITIEIFVCPSGSDHGVAQTQAMDPGARGTWVNNNSSYVWMGAGKKDAEMTYETVLAYEKPENHDYEGINVLFGDAHVEFMMRHQAEQMIPNIQFQGRR